MILSYRLFLYTDYFAVPLSPYPKRNHTIANKLYEYIQKINRKMSTPGFF